jgi:hypothetical protein
VDWASIVNRARRSLALMLVAIPQIASAAGYFEYFCPKGRDMLRVNENHLFGSSYTAFPNKPVGNQSASNERSPVFELFFTDCSNAEFYCLDGRKTHGDIAGEPLRIVVPRQVVVGPALEFGRVRVLSYGSLSTVKNPAVELVLWQQYMGKDFAIKLTVEQGRGIVYITGLNFWNPGQFEQGESCALESPKGLFSSVRVARTKVGPPIE